MGPERKTELCKQMGRKQEELRKKVSGRNKVSWRTWQSDLTGRTESLQGMGRYMKEGSNKQEQEPNIEEQAQDKKMWRTVGMKDTTEPGLAHKKGLARK